MDPLVLTEGKPCLMAYSRAVLAGWDRASVSHSSRDRRPQQHAMKACGPCVPFKIQYLPVIGRAIRYLRVEGASKAVVAPTKDSTVRWRVVAVFTA